MEQEPASESTSPDPPATLRGYQTFLRRYTVAGREWELLGPDQFERLLDDPRVIARFEQDEFMPYWAEFWPASLALAERVAQWSPPATHPSPLVLEFGCGLGLVSLVAASRGYRVIASDYDEDCLAFVEENARRNQVATIQARFIDWREHYPDLCVDRIIAAEVTYEARHLQPVATFIREHLAPNGDALLVDRNRSVADPFPDVAQRAGLSCETTPVETRDADGSVVEARVFEVRPT